MDFYHIRHDFQEHCTISKNIKIGESENVDVPERMEISNYLKNKKEEEIKGTEP